MAQHLRSLRGQHHHQPSEPFIFPLVGGSSSSSCTDLALQKLGAGTGAVTSTAFVTQLGTFIFLFAPHCYCNCTFFLDKLARCSPNKPQSLLWQGRRVLILTQSQRGCSGTMSEPSKSLGGFCATDRALLSREHPNKCRYFSCLGVLFTLTPRLPPGHPLLQPGPF